jgi:hypothetical protein
MKKCNRLQLITIFQYCVRQPRPPFKMAADTKNRNFFSCQFPLYYKSKWTQILAAAIWQTIPAKFSLIWFSGFIREDLNVIFYQNMSNLYNQYKSVERKNSQKNPEYTFKMAAVTKNRNFFSCQFPLYYKSKWTQILTAAIWQWVV